MDELGHRMRLQRVECRAALAAVGDTEAALLSRARSAEEENAKLKVALAEIWDRLGCSSGAGENPFLAIPSFKGAEGLEGSLQVLMNSAGVAADAQKAG
mmetsp:Transcript_31282/g.99800  ORF Transcript_31282/g.99800 Transcript_31282/m.99800 type:complete len:99 (-) Transcript_31282:100-396(-)